MRPSDASRPARLSALAAPLVRSTSTAFSRSPAVSSRAFLQSIMPAPVRARSAATSLAGISFTIVTPPPPHENAALAPLGLEGRRSVIQRNARVQAARRDAAGPRQRQEDGRQKSDTGLRADREPRDRADGERPERTALRRADEDE